MSAAESLPEPIRIPIAPPALPPAVRRVADTLQAAGERTLLAGGAVRDHLLGRAPKDFDLASSATPERVAELFPRTVMVGAQFGVSRVIETGDDGVDDEVEVVRFRADLEYEDGRHPVGVVFSSEAEDAKRRDFTVNGLFYDLATNEVLDYVGGYRDLGERVLRAIGDARARYREDRLRMLRAVRFATVLGFELETETWNAIVEEASAITEVSAERIRDELQKTLMHPRRELGYFLLSDSGLMQHILPEVEAMRGVEQPPEFHPEGDVHRHVGLVLSELRDPGFTVVMGALLHDIGKPPTFEILDRIRFNGHDRVGSEMADEVCRRLRFSKREREEVVYMVRRHMIWPAVSEMRVSTRKRLFEEPGFPQLLQLGYADCRGSHGDTGVCERAEELYEAYLEEGPPVEPLLGGRDLIALGMTPGPQMGDLLREVEDLRREGEFDDREGAIAWLQRERSQWFGGGAPADAGEGTTE